MWQVWERRKMRKGFDKETKVRDNLQTPGIDEKLLLKLTLME
jgi:hypothetical protein